MKIKTADTLKTLIEYILWNYDAHATQIADKSPTVTVQDLSNTWIVKIAYTAEVKKGNGEMDETMVGDEYVPTESVFTLLKTEGFRQLTKYVEEICDEIAKIELEA